MFITTSTFTQDAKESPRYVSIGTVLIDGELLASLMFEYYLGVTPRKIYVVKSIDSDYFDEP